ncbi:hypothetical protein Enr13x_08080 [Stieleria neptunia]|uniref:Secreted protein n=1 Tax=Stieleria neptunia TaxID=2527979 RepID=A0A518HJM2_9BACT|nr:hypothetical protein [Stieleria neptunia]QDV40970.1 hypothetical protein Enr13x_08080 [Stieleria neptunia]
MSRLMLPLAVFGLLVCSVVSAEEQTKKKAAKGLKAGDAIGAFHVTKVCGAEDDGVEQGERLCYRCRYQSRPMVMVFARDTGGKLNDLVKEIDAAVKANEDAQLRGFVTLMGEDAAALKDVATKVVETSGATSVPVVIAEDHVTGPSNYKLDENAAITVVLANDSKVVAARKFNKADKVNVNGVMKVVNKMLN